MAQPNGGVGLWIAGIAGLIAIGMWFALSGTRDAPPVRRPETIPPPAPTRSPAAVPAPPVRVPSPIVASGIPRISENGRLTIERAELPDEGSLTLDLDLPDEARGSNAGKARVVSTDGRRTDVMAIPLPGAGSGVRLKIDPSFLTRGRYMIEIDTKDNQALQLRRFVLEIQ
jgi:hypothetical protein